MCEGYIGSLCTFCSILLKPESILKKKRLLHFLKRGDNALIIKVNSFENLFMGEKGRKFYVTLQPGKAKESHSKLTAVSDHFFI